MNSAEIRTRWLNFFESGNSQGLKHTVVPSASLIADDPNLLLVNAGKQIGFLHLDKQLAPQLHQRPCDLGVKQAYEPSFFQEIG